MLERRAGYPSARAVVGEDLLRVSVGCERVEELWRDVDAAVDVTRVNRGARDARRTGAP